MSEVSELAHARVVKVGYKNQFLLLAPAYVVCTLCIYASSSDDWALSLFGGGAESVPHPCHNRHFEAAILVRVSDSDSDGSVYSTVV